VHKRGLRALLYALRDGRRLGHRLVGSFALVLGAFWFASLARKPFYPLYLTWVNSGLDPSLRAIAVSTTNGANFLGELAGGPVAGGVGALLGTDAALTTAALVLSPALLLYGRCT
jgi:predicted MFS family arabinose efflux permease